MKRKHNYMEAVLNSKGGIQSPKHREHTAGSHWLDQLQLRQGRDGIDTAPFSGHSGLKSQRQGATGVNAVESILHDSQEALPDHHPVLVKINFDNRNRRSKKKRDVYIKMDVDSLKNPRRRLLVREAWEQGWTLSQDPIMAWELA
ncbi:hypothetical protein R1sor_002213 [Riccia sorocarpa]|uniref:Uncharacterized protein n=1 Tax=Riccia sorocarpa TaxID=122646 RepID=A0ABD3H2C2_9MARC